MAEETTNATENAAVGSREARDTGQTAEQTAQTNILADAANQTAEQKTETGEQKTEEKTEQKTEEKTEEKKPEPRAPEEYAEFTKPEGVTEWDEPTLAEFKSVAKEQDLTQEQAQKLLDFGNAKIKAMSEAPYKLWAETQTKWQAEVKADPEIGGTKFEESVKNAAQVFVPGESNPFVKSEADAQALREALNMTGAGNNPAIVKLFVKMGALLKEPGSLTGGPVKDSADTLLAKMYPTMSGAGES